MIKELEYWMQKIRFWRNGGLLLLMWGLLALCVGCFYAFFFSIAFGILPAFAGLVCIVFSLQLGYDLMNAEKLVRQRLEQERHK